MKKNFQHIKNIFPIVIALVFLAGIVSAVPYNAPTITYPTNTSKLVDVGYVFNTKSGGLSVDAFSSAKDAQFNNSATFLGRINGAPNGSGTTLRFGGYDDSANPAKTRITSITSSGYIQATEGLFSQETTTSSGEKTLCATPAGKVVFCDTSSPAPIICGNGIVQSGEQCDDGNTTNGDGCSSSCQIEAPPSVDLCPDATNPDPVFAGVQNPLPSDVTIIDGLCKIKISAAVTYWCSATNSQGSVRYTFSFDRPVPADMMIYVAWTSSGNYQNNIKHIATTSQYYNFQFPPATNENDNHGVWIYLTKGMTSYITPFPKLSNVAAESPYQDINNFEACLDHMSSEYKTSGSYFKVGNNAPNIYVTDFRSTGAPSRNPDYKIYNQ